MNSEDIGIDVNISTQKKKKKIKIKMKCGGWGGGFAIIATISVLGTKSCFIVNALYMAAAVGRGVERVESGGWILIGPEIYSKGRSMLYC